MKRLALILALLAAPAGAVEPDEILDDPVLEERARALSTGLRCPVCQNETIDESSAPTAKELRVVLRERLVAGDTDEEIMDYMVARFGEFVRMTPDTGGANILLWLSGPALLLAGLGIGWVTVRSRATAPTKDLSPEEQAKLEKILRS